jgi:DNA-binding NarL/FixJ family response regulator
MLILCAANSIPACPLSPRQRSVIRLVADGYRNKQIAHALNISIKTVETHRTHAMGRIGAETTADVVRYAIRHGLTHL